MGCGSWRKYSISAHSETLATPLPAQHGSTGTTSGGHTIPVCVRLMMPTFTVGHLSTGKRSKAGCGSSASGWECKEPLHLL